MYSHNFQKMNHTRPKTCLEASFCEDLVQARPKSTSDIDKRHINLIDFETKVKTLPKTDQEQRPDCLISDEQDWKQVKSYSSTELNQISKKQDLPKLLDKLLQLLTVSNPSMKEIKSYMAEILRYHSKYEYKYRDKLNEFLEDKEELNEPNRNLALAYLCEWRREVQEKVAFENAKVQCSPKTAVQQFSKLASTSKLIKKFTQAYSVSENLVESLETSNELPTNPAMLQTNLDKLAKIEAQTLKRKTLVTQFNDSWKEVYENVKSICHWVEKLLQFDYKNPDFSKWLEKNGIELKQAIEKVFLDVRFLKFSQTDDIFQNKQRAIRALAFCNWFKLTFNLIAFGSAQFGNYLQIKDSDLLEEKFYELDKKLKEILDKLSSESKKIKLSEILHGLLRLLQNYVYIGLVKLVLIYMNQAEVKNQLCWILNQIEINQQPDEGLLMDHLYKRQKQLQKQANCTDKKLEHIVIELEKLEKQSEKLKEKEEIFKSELKNLNSEAEQERMQIKQKLGRISKKQKQILNKSDYNIYFKLIKGFSNRFNIHSQHLLINQRQKEALESQTIQAKKKIDSTLKRFGAKYNLTKRVSKITFKKRRVTSRFGNLKKSSEQKQCKNFIGQISRLSKKTIILLQQNQQVIRQDWNTFSPNTAKFVKQISTLVDQIEKFAEETENISSQTENLMCIPVETALPENSRPSTSKATPSQVFKSFNAKYWELFPDTFDFYLQLMLSDLFEKYQKSFEISKQN